MTTPLSIDAINELLAASPTSTTAPQDDNHAEAIAETHGETATGHFSPTSTPPTSDPTPPTSANAALDAELDAEVSTVLTTDLNDALDAELDAEIENELAKPSSTATSTDIDKIYDAVTDEIDTPAATTPIVTTPRSRHSAKTPVSEFISDAALTAMCQTRDTIDAAIAAMPIKAQAKARNMIAFFEHQDTLSVYTQIGLRELLVEGLANSSDLCSALMNDATTPYPHSTASSQASQLMALFPVMGIASQKGNVLHLNRHSPLLIAFQNLAEAK